MNEVTIDSKAEMSLLKDFQRHTVNHAFQRLYGRKNGSGRFLVADEVGLGKTMVARGIVAKSIEHLEREVAEAKSQLEEYQATDADTWYATTLAGKIDGLRIAIRYVKGA